MFILFFIYLYIYILQKSHSLNKLFFFSACFIHVNVGFLSGCLVSSHPKICQWVDWISCSDVILYMHCNLICCWCALVAVLVSCHSLHYNNY